MTGNRKAYVDNIQTMMKDYKAAHVHSGHFNVICYKGVTSNTSIYRTLHVYH